MGLLTASSFFVCLLKGPGAPTHTHPLTHPTLAQQLKNVNYRIKKPSPIYFCRYFCFCELFIIFFKMLTGYELKGPPIFFLFCVFIWPGEPEQSLNISFEKASSAMGAECGMHEYVFSFINEELKCS